MSYTIVAACFVSFSMSCNGINLTTPYHYNDSQQVPASPDMKALAAHMYGRIWTAKGTLPANPAAKLTCRSLYINQECSGVSANMSLDGFQVDDIEFGLITKIWGGLFGAAPPVTITIPTKPATP